MFDFSYRHCVDFVERLLNPISNTLGHRIVQVNKSAHRSREFMNQLAAYPLANW